MRIVLFGTEGGFSSTRNFGISARGNSCKTDEHLFDQGCLYAHLHQANELVADAVHTVGDADGIVELRIFGVHVEGTLHHKSAKSKNGLQTIDSYILGLARV